MHTCMHMHEDSHRVAAQQECGQQWAQPQRWHQQAQRQVRPRRRDRVAPPPERSNSSNLIHAHINTYTHTAPDLALELHRREQRRERVCTAAAAALAAAHSRPCCCCCGRGCGARERADATRRASIRRGKGRWRHGRLRGGSGRRAVGAVDAPLGRARRFVGNIARRSRSSSSARGDALSSISSSRRRRCAGFRGRRACRRRRRCQWRRCLGRCVLHRCGRRCCRRRRSSSSGGGGCRQTTLFQLPSASRRHVHANRARSRGRPPRRGHRCTHTPQITGQAEPFHRGDGVGQKHTLLAAPALGTHTALPSRAVWRHARSVGVLGCAARLRGARGL